ncbi:Auxin-responsive protein SAUR24, partial [Bienertia sinuspersici]
ISSLFILTINFIYHPIFQDLLQLAEEEFGFHHPMGALTISYTEVTLFNITFELKC